MHWGTGVARRAALDRPAPRASPAGKLHHLTITLMGVGKLGLVDSAVAHQIEDYQRVVPLVGSG